MSGIELVYDATRVISSGDAVDFEKYRTQLNKSLKVGSVVYGQQAAWKTWMAAEYDRKHGWRRHQNEWYFRADENPALVASPWSRASRAKARRSPG